MEKIIDACKRGDVVKFKQLFSQLDDHRQCLHNRDKDGRKLIHNAAEGGNKEIVSIILDKGGPEQALTESRHDRNIAINIALMSGKPAAPDVASLLLNTLKELRAVPKRNRDGNYPLHYACKAGYNDLIKSLYEVFPDTLYAENAKGRSPLSFAVWEGNREAVSILLDRATGTPYQFGDFSSLFNTSKATQLDSFVDLFVLGDNRCGKSSVIKSIQVENSTDRFWGIAWSTPDVPSNKIGLVPTDFNSKYLQRVVFHDLASGANFSNMDLIQSEEHLKRALFIIVIDSRPERKEMANKLEFWLNVVHKQYSKVSRDPAARPNVILVSSFSDVVMPFRNAPEIRLHKVYRKVCSANRALVSSMNIVEYQPLNCQKAQSPQMDKIRHALKKTCRQLRPNLPPVSSHAHILSIILADLEQDDNATVIPMISLEDLSQKIEDKSAVSPVCLHGLVPSDIPQLLNLCQILESRNRILLLKSGPHFSDEDISIVYGQHKLAGIIDDAFSQLLNEQHSGLHGRPTRPIPHLALIEKKELQDLLADRLGIRVDLIDQLLDYFKIHSSSEKEDRTHLPFDEPHYFFPTFLPKDTHISDEWPWQMDDDSGFQFAWTFQPILNQLYHHFMPSFTNSLLTVLFDACAGAKIDFDHRHLWVGGIDFRQKELEVCVMISNRNIILNIRYSSKHGEIEISALRLRNKLLQIIRKQKVIHQHDIETEEFIVPNYDGAKFPISSPPSPRYQTPLNTLQQSISASSLSLASSFSLLPQIPPKSGRNSTEINPFFEPCLYLSKLSIATRQKLMLPEHADEELSDPFLEELRMCFGDDLYQKIAIFFGLPPLAFTSEAVSGGSLPSSPSPPSTPTRSHHRRNESMGVKCNTYGKLVKRLNSISIFNTRQFLEDLQRRELSSGTPTVSTSISVADLSQSSRSQSADGSTPTADPPPSRLLPNTLQPVSSHTTHADLSDVHLLDSIQVFTCTTAGGVFHSAQNDITIKIPRGAVPEVSSPISVQFAVALSGPFDLPVGKRPVSSFVWLCTNIPDFVFLKPIEITLPHYIHLTSRADCSKLTFMEAKHNEGIGKGFQFRECTDKSIFTPRNNCGVLRTTHTCFLCIAGEISRSMDEKVKYCLVRVVPKEYSGVFMIQFIATYFLKTCFWAVQQQFDESYEVSKTMVNMSSTSEDPELFIRFQTELPNGWSATNDNGKMSISASEIEFWHQDIHQLEEMYPPRFSIVVCGDEATKNTIMDIQFEGLTKPKKFQVMLRLHPSKSSMVVGKIDVHAGPNPHIHLLDEMIADLVKFLDVDMIRIQLRVLGILTEDELTTLHDLSVSPKTNQFLRVERLVQVLKRKGDAGMTAFKRALELTTDGTGHGSILDALNQKGDGHNEADPSDMNNIKLDPEVNALY